MHDPNGPTPKPASTWGNTAGAALHNVHYRTSAYPTSASGERVPDRCRRPPAVPRRTNSSKGNYIRECPNVTGDGSEPKREAARTPFPLAVTAERGATGVRAVAVHAGWPDACRLQLGAELAVSGS